MSPPRRKPVTTLSRRQRQCLLWIARGKGYIEIGMIEGIAYATVKCYLDSARYKLNCATLAAATALAAGRGIFTLEEIEGKTSVVLDDPDAADKDMKQTGDKQDQPAPKARIESPHDPGQQIDEHPETERP